MDNKEYIDAIVEFIITGNKEGADSILNKKIEDFSHRYTIQNILEPALKIIGQKWNNEEISLAAGYLAGKIAEEILIRTIENEPKIEEYKGTAVIGNIEDDYHSLGRKLITVFLIASGWNVIDLGNDITPQEFIEAAIKENADVIGVSAMMYTTAKKIIDVRKKLDEHNLTGKIKLAVGGAIFNLRPDLVKEVGGDGTALNAVDVPNLFNKLKREIQ